MSTPIPGAIASEHGSASHLGAATLARGGNAVDAAITTTLAVHLFCPYHSCIGGSGFALVREPPKTSSSDSAYSYVDFRGTAPRAITQEYIQDKDTMVGGNSVIVPGEIKGLKQLHERFGKLAWKECVAPVVRLAREGVPMGKDLYDVSRRIAGGEGWPHCSMRKTGERPRRRGAREGRWTRTLLPVLRNCRSAYPPNVTHDACRAQRFPLRCVRLSSLGGRHGQHAAHMRAS